MHVVYLSHFLSEILVFHLHSVGTGQVFQHLSLNVNSGPLDSESDIKTITCTTKRNSKETMNERKKSKKLQTLVYCAVILLESMQLAQSESFTQFQEVLVKVEREII